MGSQAVQAGEESEAIDTVFVERSLQCRSDRLGNCDLFYILRFEFVVRFRMDSEKPSLICDTRREVSRDKFPHAFVAKWFRIFLHVDIGFVLIRIDHAVIFAGFLDSEVAGD